MLVKNAAIDFTKIYEFVEGVYSEDNGRPSVDPVVLFKIVLIQHIYGIPSLRREYEPCIPMVHRIPAERSSTALFDSELQLQASVQYSNGGVCIPLGVKSGSG